MGEVVNYSDIIKINFLGYNFADWVKMFKRKYKQEDGTYDFMGYLFDQENKAAYYIMRANLGMLANIYLNVRYASIMNDIDVVGGGKKEQTGGMLNGFGFCLLVGLFLLFTMFIDSKKYIEATQKASLDKTDINKQISVATFLAINGNINGEMGLSDIPSQYQNIKFLNEVVLKDRPADTFGDKLLNGILMKTASPLLHVPGETLTEGIGKSLGQFGMAVGKHIAENAFAKIKQMSSELPVDDKQKLDLDKVRNGGVNELFVDVTLIPPTDVTDVISTDVTDVSKIGGRKKSRKIKKNKKNKKSRRK